LANERTHVQITNGSSGTMGQLTDNEQAWIEFIRVISGGRDPRVTPARVRALRELLDAG